MKNMKTIESLEKDKCTGCGACVNSCPGNSITMQTDKTGFLYPIVDTAACNICGNCVTCCPVIHPPVLPEIEPQVYAAWSLDEDVRFNSTSGGIFTELARAVLRQKGFVIGAKYNERHLVEHATIEKPEDIHLLRQSKYVQSDTADIYRQTESALKTKRPVFFVGTPCQCAGLTVFVKKHYENLILCDFICRGVNSPMAYLKYLDELEAQYGSRIKQVWFKNKTCGWNKFCTKIVFEGGQEYLGGRDTDPFMYGFIKKGLNLYMRASCGQCKFKGTKRPVDITLGDFWGISLHGSDDNTDAGVSVVMIHSPKGRALFSQIQEKIYFEKHALEEVLQHNVCLMNSVNIQKDSGNFYQELHENGFNKTIVKYKEQNYES